MKPTRRDFLTATTAAAIAARASPVCSAPFSDATDDSFGVLVDIPNCIGCRKCEYACQEAAGFPVPPIETYEDKSVLAQPRRPEPRSYTVINAFADPDRRPDPWYVKTNCFHCVDPACASACLVGALTKRPDGPVVYDAWKCMGCRYCMVACPFQIPAYDYSDPITPQVRKCTFCADRLREPGGVPACVKICPRECLTFGKRAGLLALAHEKIRSQPDVYVDHVYGESEAGGTSWLYLSGVPFEQLSFLPLGAVAPSRLTEAIQHGVFKFFVPPIALYALLGIIKHLAAQSEGPPHALLPTAAADQPVQRGAEGAATDDDGRISKKVDGRPQPSKRVRV